MNKETIRMSKLDSLRFNVGIFCGQKITPCMQNGKSFLADSMPTEYGFGSTEFHVLRQKSEKNPYAVPMGTALR